MKNAEIAALLEKSGLRATQQRIAVYSYLFDNRIHPTADKIYESLVADYPSFSRTTVYNSLHALQECGLIRTVTIDSLEQRFDVNPADHGHFKCSSCSRVFDFDFSPEIVQELCPKGFLPAWADIYITGTCVICSQKNRSI